MKIPTNRAPTTVVEMLKEEVIKPLGLTQQEFANALGVDRPAVNAILNGRRAITPEMALRLARVLRTSPELWLNLQMQADLYAARRSPRAKEIQKLRSLSTASAKPHDPISA